MDGGGTHLALASLTLIRGLARSSLSRWLCSVRRRSLSSDMDCLWGREFMAGMLRVAGSGTGLGSREKAGKGWEERREKRCEKGWASDGRRSAGGRTGLALGEGGGCGGGGQQRARGSGWGRGKRLTGPGEGGSEQEQRTDARPRRSLALALSARRFPSASRITALASVVPSPTIVLPSTALDIATAHCQTRCPTLLALAALLDALGEGTGVVGRRN